jgi:hypothetical protein
VTGDARKLPLWKSWLEANESRLAYGAQFTSKELTEYLGMTEEDLQFAMSIHHIRKALRRKGMNFTARGQYGAGYAIAQPGTNQAEMRRMANVAASAMREGVILGTCTPLDLLTDEERRIHESLTEKMATRLALMRRKLTAPDIEGRKPKAIE